MRCRHLLTAFTASGWRRNRFRLREPYAFLCFGLCALFMVPGLNGCGRAARPFTPVTITLLDPGWPDSEFVQWRKHEEEDFMRETGILVRDLPAPETAVDQLVLWRNLLENPSEAPDVFAIDVIWPRVMAGYSLPLNPYLSDTAQDFPSLVANDMVNGELVAMPYHADAGLLFYRADLLQAYGYQAPPDTWDELEKMAARIQKGERSKGKKDFWDLYGRVLPLKHLLAMRSSGRPPKGAGKSSRQMGPLPSTIAIRYGLGKERDAGLARFLRRASSPTASGIV